MGSNEDIWQIGLELRWYHKNAKWGPKLVKVTEAFVEGDEIEWQGIEVF